MLAETDEQMDKVTRGWTAGGATGFMREPSRYRIMEPVYFYKKRKQIKLEMLSVTIYCKNKVQTSWA